MAVKSEQQVPFTTLESVRIALNDFFRFKEPKVLMIKGPWGVGKSFFLREYIDQNVPSAGKGSILPDWISYASLFGCKSTQQVEERVVASIQSSTSWNKPSKSSLAHAFKEFCSNARFSLAGISFNLPVHSLIWRFTKHKGLLLVLDDLERANDDLKIADILGFVSSLGENSTGGVKIIVVCNAGRLGEESADELAVLREKVIHTELLFNPSPEELVEEYFYHPQQRATMTFCLRMIEEGNIRIIERTSKALTVLNELFSKNGVSLLDEDKNTIVRLCVFYFRVGRTITKEWFRHRLIDDLLSDNDTEQERDPARELFGKLEAEWDDLGPVVIDWLSFGSVDPTVLQLATASLNSKQWREQFRKRSSEAYKPWNSNFITTDVTQLAKPVMDLVDDYCGASLNWVGKSGRDFEV